MAYEGGIGGTFKTLWSPDLTTRAGALNAAQTASTALFIVAALSALRLWLSVGTDNLIRLVGEGELGTLITVGLVVVMLAAGMLLRRGRGLIVGTLAMLLYLVFALLNGSPTSWIVGAVLLGAMVGGLRGALALQRGVGFSDDTHDVFA
ncbi:hypothetical protein CVO77_09850 [Sphingopyxis lindanitolerans]|uniref:Uncharacterized protein n=1 Tax=Sphingopyxis lindanitolerans TaxID=2054227 RepID=A0A2S8B8I2_9SPHN|nr:hypothetical protein [Sphingopyxis lindanitolerans]PQM28724.1 hypothetical protein CVO77_09850 [Sphingopyxis lindanitolerans]